MISLDEMPLDSPEHIRMAWHLIRLPVTVRAIRRGKMPHEADAALAAARERIQLAAVEHGMGWLPDS